MNTYMLFRFLLDFLFPPRCLHCRRYVMRGCVLCAPCAATITLHASLFCGHCRARLPRISKVCHKNHPFLLGAATDYQNKVIQSIVKAAKFEFSRDGATFLGEILGEYAKLLPLSLTNAIVVPIPLGKKRFRERGFNQSEYITKILGKRLALPVVPDALLRQNNTRPQSDLRSHEERARNVAGAFLVRDAAYIKNKTVILVDDVVTSGATFLDASRALKAGGAKHIIALAAAKA